VEKREVQIRGIPAMVKPLFADEVMLAVTLKASKEKDEKGRIKKEGHVRLGFIDAMKGQMIAEVVLSSMTAKALLKILDENLEKLDKELESEEPPKEIVATTKTEEIGYIR